MDVDYLLSVRQEPVYEPMTYEKYLMISKHKKKMSVHYNEVTKRTKYNIVGNCCSASPEHRTFVWQIQEG
jgi:methionine synthase I (cobalamin-dependent)